MTAHLLDTHALLWALTAPDRLGPAALEVIADADSTLWVSAASAWEIATKNRRGRLGQADGLLAGYSRHLIRLGATELPITSDHALLAGTLDWEHRDPFDRMIAAQAMIEGLTLITGDAQLRSLGGVATLW